MFARPRLAGAFIRLSVTAQADLDWIHIQLDSEVIERRLDSKQRGRTSGSTHGCRSTDVQFHFSLYCRNVGAAIEHRSGIHAVFQEFVDERSVVANVVDQCGELAVLGCADANLLLDGRTVADRGEH